MANRSKNVFVTGGAGYIGSHTCLALAEAGFTPVTYDNLVNGHRAAVKWGVLEEGDIADYQRLKVLFGKYEPAAVLHFAAFAYVGESVRNPGRYYRNNVAGALSLLEAMRDSGLNHIIFSSSCSVYGEPETMPITEEHPLLPVNPYGRSKLMIESMLADFEKAHGLESVSLRYFNAAGADPEGRLGEDHDPETHLIPLAVQAALGQGLELEIYGLDYPTPDGTAVRDYIHVTDLAEAHVRALRYLLVGSGSAVFNLGTGRGYSVRQVISAVEKVTGKTVPARLGPRRQGDPAVLIAAAEKARNILNWRPQYSELETIIDTAARWSSKR